MHAWAGAFVKWNGGEKLVETLDAHFIDVVARELAPGWLYVRVAASEERGGRVPEFAESLSRSLESEVVAFHVDPEAGIQDLVAFEAGRHVRTLRHRRDEGGWQPGEGTPRPWEEHLFFAGRPELPAADDAAPSDGDGTSSASPSAAGPENLRPELSAAERERYRGARRTGDASAVFDLLTAGYTSDLERLGRHLGIDPKRPHGRHESPQFRRYLMKVALAAVVICMFWGFMFSLGLRHY
ncbi:MAG: hypothetical protein AAGN82_30290 [Myxococcota bacterium]